MIRKGTIEAFASDNANSRSSFRFWLSMLRMADWEAPEDIQQTFGSADLLGNGSKRVVFNIGGNHYRMICKYHFSETRVHLFIKWIGTHSAYDELCKKRKQYTVDIY